MKKEAIILVVEGDESDFALIETTLQRCGISNDIIRFATGQALLEFLFGTDQSRGCDRSKSYLLIVDSPNGIGVLEKVKQDGDLKKIPVIMFTAQAGFADLPRSHELGSTTFILKPDQTDEFIDAVEKIGLFLSVVEVPEVSSENYVRKL